MSGAHSRISRSSRCSTAASTVSRSVPRYERPTHVYHFFWSGPLPEQLPVSLEVLDLSGGGSWCGEDQSHKFTDGIPSGWAELTNLKELKMTRCGLGGAFDSTRSERFRFRHSLFSAGRLPVLLGKLVNLKELYLSGNFLRGERSAPVLSGFAFSLTLHLPAGRLPELPASLEVLALGEYRDDTNKFTDAIPPEWGVLTNLKELMLVNCGLRGKPSVLSAKIFLLAGFCPPLSKCCRVRQRPDRVREIYKLGEFRSVWKPDKSAGRCIDGFRWRHELQESRGSGGFSSVLEMNAILSVALGRVPKELANLTNLVKQVSSERKCRLTVSHFRFSYTCSVLCPPPPNTIY